MDVSHVPVPKITKKSLQAETQQRWALLLTKNCGKTPEKKRPLGQHEDNAM